MKKINRILKAALVLTVLTGCTNATAKLKDSSSALITVNGKSITKGDVYNIMMSSNGASQAVKDATKTIVNAEVEITDDMKTQADSMLSYYKTLYGDTFSTYLESSGLSEEDYMNKSILPSLQAEELPKKYVEQNYDELVSKYMPVKGSVIAFDSEENANSALSVLKDGTSDAAAAAEAYGSSSDASSKIYSTQSSLDSAVWSALRASTAEEGWKTVAGDDGSFYVIRLDSNDTEALKDDIITEIASYDTTSSDANTYFFKKYSFHVYDINLYNSIGNSSDYSSYLVQTPVDTAN